MRELLYWEMWVGWLGVKCNSLLETKCRSNGGVTILARRARRTTHAPGGRPARPAGSVTDDDDRRQTPASKTTLAHLAGK